LIHPGQYLDDDPRYCRRFQELALRAWTKDTSGNWTLLAEINFRHGDRIYCTESYCAKA